MWFILAIVSAVIFGAAGLFMKASQAKGGNHAHLLLGLYVFGSIGFLLHTLSLEAIDWQNLELWIFGVIIGIGSAWGNLIWMRALEFGPASLTSLLTNMNIVLVILIATLWYNESLSMVQLSGIILLLCAISLISIRPNDSLTVKERTWFLFISLAIILFTFRNGGLKITSELELASSAVLLIGYSFSVLWFSVQVLLLKNNNKKAARIGFFWGCLAGLCSYGGLQLYAIALEQGPANVIAPIFATNSLIIAIGAILFFHERLNRYQMSACILLVLGLIFVRM